MCDPVPWLPDLVLFEECSGVWPKYVEVLHGYFVADFVRSKPRWPGKRVNLKRYPEYEGKSATFWHFISEGEDEAERVPDLRRCERIRWPRPMMDEFKENPPTPDSRMVWWKEKRRGETRYVLCSLDFSYKVVVADRGEYVLPWTAYCVEREHERAKLQRKYEAYWKSPW